MSRFETNLLQTTYFHLLIYVPVFGRRSRSRFFPLIYMWAAPRNTFLISGGFVDVLEKNLQTCTFCSSVKTIAATHF